MVYYGNICDGLMESDLKVCSSHGNCTGFDHCSCDENFAGESCDLYSCNGVLGNSSEVCSRNGVCVEGRCFCYDTSYYISKIDCSSSQALESLLYIGPGILILLVVIIVFIVILCCSFFVIRRMRKRLKRIDKIEDIDIILEEAELEQKDSTSRLKFKMKKKSFFVDFKDIKIIKHIGEGGSEAQVFLVSYKGTYCAYKGFKRNPIDTTESFDQFEKEMEIYVNFDHPHILQSFGAIFNPPRVGILMEFCKNGDLSRWLTDYKMNKGISYSAVEKFRILKEIASGMRYLHSKNLMHRDLKPENILIDDHESAKIMDFGLSKLSGSENDKTHTVKIGTSFYIAPEVLSGKKYSKLCDVYSYAFLVYVIITEEFFPFGHIADSLIFKRMKNDISYRPKIDDKSFKKFSFLKEFIQKNWNVDPTQRNSFDQIVSFLEDQVVKKPPPKPNSRKVSFSDLNKELKKMELKLKKKDQEIRRLQSLLNK